MVVYISVSHSLSLYCFNISRSIRSFICFLYQLKKWFCIFIVFLINSSVFKDEYKVFIFRNKIISFYLLNTFMVSVDLLTFIVFNKTQSANKRENIFVKIELVNKFFIQFFAIVPFLTRFMGHSFSENVWAKNIPSINIPY